MITIFDKHEVYIKWPPGFLTSKLYPTGHVKKERRCEALSLVPLQLKDPLELVSKEGNFLQRLGLFPFRREFSSPVEFDLILKKELVTLMLVVATCKLAHTNMQNKTHEKLLKPWHMGTHLSTQKSSGLCAFDESNLNIGRDIVA